MAAVNYDLVEPVLEGDNLKPFEFVNKVVAAVTPQALKNKEANLNEDSVKYEEDTETRGMLVESPNRNTKKYRDGATYSRLSATAEGNMCWFASFLTAVSDTYSMYNLNDRIEITKAFREYCRQHVDEIKAAFPEKMATSSIYSTAVAELEETLNTKNREIEKQEGFIIAWYFGFNNVFLRVEDEGSIAPDAATAYQSEDCPVVIFYIIPIGTATGHYEILCVRKDGVPLTFDTNFQWSDKRLCDLKVKFTTCDKGFLNDETIMPWLCDWTLPECDGAVEDNPFPTFAGTKSPVPSPEGSVSGNTNNSNSIGSSAFESDSNASSNNGSTSPEPNTPEEEPNTPGGNNLRKLYGNKNNFEEEPEKTKESKGSVNNFVAPGEVPENFYKNNSSNKTPKGSVNNFVAPGEVPENFYKNNNENKNNVSKLRIGVPKGENNSNKTPKGSVNNFVAPGEVPENFYKNNNTNSPTHTVVNEPIANAPARKPTSFNNNSNTRVAFGPTKTRKNKNKKNKNANTSGEVNLSKIAKPSGPNPKKALENKLKASAEAAKARAAGPKKWQIVNQGVKHRGESAPGLAGATALPSSNMLRGPAAAARKTRRRKDRKGRK